jgi:hypothetical protein
MIDTSQVRALLSPLVQPITGGSSPDKPLLLIQLMLTRISPLLPLILANSLQSGGQALPSWWVPVSTLTFIPFSIPSLPAHSSIAGKATCAHTW